MQPFTSKVVDIVKSIPEGRVMTYGQIAACAGSPRGARQVVRILHSLSGKHRLPWHRVVNAKGEIALTDGESRYMQEHYLRQEGVETDGQGRLDLERYRYWPESETGV
ncbi:MGMT family protein [Cohnella thermotolerans]|jgi:methylated-DNA-protein-cysteine methyltransferase-like protein|uniref:MGMT family protein n=1 Tax=Cohnella thermotolerans TaxID=329858 RepID=UPI0003F58FDB|nr:MGMT family protein [Cohnella thermotolerans]